MRLRVLAAASSSVHRCKLPFKSIHAHSNLPFKSIHAHSQVWLPRLCCVFMPAEFDGLQPGQLPSHLVLDLRSARSPPAATGRTFSKRHEEPLLQLSQQISLGHSSAPMVAALHVSSLNMYTLASRDATMNATCLLSLQPGPAHNGKARKAALAVRVVVAAGALGARSAVAGNQLASAWAQAEAHRRRDWMVSSARSLHKASAQASEGAPEQGRLFPTAFSAEQARCTATAGSTSQIAVSVPAAAAHVPLDLLPDIARICGGCARLLRSSAPGDEAPRVASKHVVATVTAAGNATLVGTEGVYELTVASVDVLHGQGLGRLAGASLTHGGARGVHLTLMPEPGTSGKQAAALLYHIPEDPHQVRCCIVVAFVHVSCAKHKSSVPQTTPKFQSVMRLCGGSVRCTRAARLRLCGCLAPGALAASGGRAAHRHNCVARHAWRHVRCAGW